MRAVAAVCMVALLSPTCCYILTCDLLQEIVPKSIKLAIQEASRCCNVLIPSKSTQEDSNAARHRQVHRTVQPLRRHRPVRPRPPPANLRAKADRRGRPQLA